MDIEIVAEVWKILNNYADEIRAAFDGETIFLKMLKDYEKDSDDNESYEGEDDDDWDDEDAYGNTEW